MSEQDAFRLRVQREIDDILGKSATREIPALPPIKLRRGRRRKLIPNTEVLIDAAERAYLRRIWGNR